MNVNINLGKREQIKKNNYNLASWFLFHVFKLENEEKHNGKDTTRIFKLKKSLEGKSLLLKTIS